MIDEELLAWAALHALGVPGSARAEVVAHGGARALFAAGAGRVAALVREATRHEVGAHAVAAAFAAARRLEGFVEAGGAILGGPDAGSLGRLAQRDGAPLCLFARGDRALLHAARTVAIVGARACSARGRHLALELSAAFAEAGVVVISGGARGIDEAAHQGALEVGGATLAVLGECVRRDGGDERPGRLRRLLRGDAARRALTVTTGGPWVEAQRFHFAARNRHVAALADALVVVEGMEGSGTRYTVKAARKLEVPVWAVAGRAEEALASTPNGLLEERAARWLKPNEDPVAAVFGAACARPVSVDEEPTGLLALLRRKGGRVDIDEAARLLDVEVSVVLAEACLLELEGRLAREGSSLVRRRAAAR